MDVNLDRKPSNHKTDEVEGAHQSTNSQSETNTLDLTPEMIDLLVKAGISLEKSLDHINYQANIICQLQDDMNDHPKKYSKRDAELLGKMKKQLKENPIFTRPESDMYIKMPKDLQNTTGQLTNLDINLSSINLDSEEKHDKHKQFYKERVLSGVYQLYLFFDGLSTDLYQKAFKFIDELLCNSTHALVNFQDLKLNHELLS